MAELRGLELVSGRSEPPALFVSGPEVAVDLPQTTATTRRHPGPGGVAVRCGAGRLPATLFRIHRFRLCPRCRDLVAQGGAQPGGDPLFFEHPTRAVSASQDRHGPTVTGACVCLAHFVWIFCGCLVLTSRCWVCWVVCGFLLKLLERNPSCSEEARMGQLCPSQDFGQEGRREPTQAPRHQQSHGWCIRELIRLCRALQRTE